MTAEAQLRRCGRRMGGGAQRLSQRSLVARVELLLLIGRTLYRRRTTRCIECLLAASEESISSSVIATTQQGGLK